MRYNNADMKDKCVAVLGAGQMGGGIAQVCASAGMRVYLYDAHAAQTSAAMSVIAKSAQKAHEKGASPPADDVVGNITLCDSLDKWLSEAVFVVEAISEDFAAKTELYEKAAPLLSDSAVFATNTSSFSIAGLSAAVVNPQNFIGVHFMNPAPRMRLVEIIPGKDTSPATVTEAESFAQGLGKDTVLSADSPGFITNRILMPLINEAIFALHDNIGNAQDIDRAMTLGMNHPMGPLTLADFIGLDTCLAVLRVLHEGLKDDKFTPCPLLLEKVSNGDLGRKSGRGFYDYSDGGGR